MFTSAQTVILLAPEVKIEDTAQTITQVCRSF